MTAVMLFAHITTQVGIYAFGADKHWLDVLNMDRELNLPTLFSTMLLLTAARLLMQLSKASLQESADDWTLLSRIFMFLAVDEALQIHEILILPDLRHHIHPALASTWVIPYSLISIGLLLRFRHFLTTLSAKTSNGVLCAGGVYISGAIGMNWWAALPFARALSVCIVSGMGLSRA